MWDEEWDERLLAEFVSRLRPHGSAVSNDHRVDAAAGRVADRRGSHACLVDLGVAPQWDRLRDDLRFAECLALMGL